MTHDRTQTLVLAGRFAPGAPDFVEVPFDVPAGVREIAVRYAFDTPEVPLGAQPNACDAGLLGPGGFRGWSGGARREFAVGAGHATPGYLPGPVDPGRWRVLLGPYTVAPGGMAYEVTVTLRFGAPQAARTPRYPASQAAGRGRAWYRGDCHLHTVHSDGARTPAELVAAARAAGLDFIVTTEHNTPSAHREFGALDSGALLVLTGEEVTTRNGHLLALGIVPGEWVDWRWRARDPEAFARAAARIRGLGGIAVPAHPYGPHLGSGWKHGYAHADAVEVWNGTWTLDDEAALATWDNLLGHRWTPAAGGSDAHREPQAVGHPQTVVLADALERGAILDGIRAGRSYVAESAAVTLSLTATTGTATTTATATTATATATAARAGGTGPGRSAGMGEVLTAAEDAIVTVTAECAGVADPVVRLVSDKGQVHVVFPVPGEPARAEWRTSPAATSWVRAEVRHADGGTMAALSNPVRLAAAHADG